MQRYHPAKHDLVKQKNYTYIPYSLKTPISPMYNTSRDKKKTSAFDIETHPLLIVIIYRYTVLVILDLLEMDTSARVKSYTSHLMPHSLYDVCITADV